MKNKLSNILIGIVFIVGGIIFCGNILNFWDVDVFFDGWWTLFIIIPAFISMFGSGFNFANSFILALSVLLLVSEQTDFSMTNIWKLIGPLAFIWIGISLILKSFKVKSRRNSITENLPEGKTPSYIAVFSGQEKNYANKQFYGANITCVFGGIDLDLRRSIITTDVTINATNVFGGSDIFLPDNVKCVLSDTPIFGGVDNHHVDSINPNAPIVYINGMSVFGGMDIK